MSGIDAAVLITPVCEALTLAELTSVGIADTCIAVHVARSEATDTAFIAESLVLGTAVSAPEVFTDTQSIGIEVGVCYTVIAVAWVRAATAVTPDVAVSVPV